jgi:hypothetical protein
MTVDKSPLRSFDLYFIAFEKRRLIPFEELRFLNGKRSDSGLKTRLKT